jgi:hypothetical protein
MFVELYYGYSVNVKYLYSFKKIDDKIIEYILINPNNDGHITKTFSYSDEYLRDSYYNDIYKVCS